MRRFTALVAFLLFTLPSFAAAAGLVPCGAAGQESCQLCHTVPLLSNVMQWILTMLAVVAGMMLVYAGFVAVTSAGQTNGLEFVKRTLANIALGVLIALAAWLIVDTFLRGLLNADSYGIWNEIQCVAQPQPQRYEASGRGNATLTPYEVPTEDLECDFLTNNFNCSAQNQDCIARGGTPGEPVNGVVRCTFPPRPIVGGTCTPQADGPCSEAALRAAGFGNLAPQAAQIVGIESGCNPRAQSGSDTTTDGRSYSIGIWQINLAVHTLSCNGQNLNCPSAFVDNGTRNNLNVREYRIVNEALYQQCVTAAMNPQCNNAKGAELANASGDMGDWACSAVRCNVPTTRNHLCPL